MPKYKQKLLVANDFLRTIQFLTLSMMVIEKNREC